MVDPARVGGDISVVVVKDVTTELHKCVKPLPGLVCVVRTVTAGWLRVASTRSTVTKERKRKQKETKHPGDNNTLYNWFFLLYFQLNKRK